MLLRKHTFNEKTAARKGRPSLARPSKAQSVATLLTQTNKIPRHCPTAAIFRVGQFVSVTAARALLVLLDVECTGSKRE